MLCIILIGKWSGATEVSQVTVANAATVTPTATITPVQNSAPVSYEPKETSSDGLLRDIELIDLDEPIKPTRRSCSLDIDHFFSASYEKNGKKYRDCLTCM